jgi:type IV fimbrial biogenesis protein FimT
MLTGLRITRQTGMTLIELMTTVSIAVILASVATPSFTAFLRNTEVRGSSESLSQGLQFARTEAVRRNQQVCFDWSGAGTGWTVSTGCAFAVGTVPAANVIQISPNHDGSIATVVSITPGGGQRVTFNAYGRVTPNPAGGASITRIDVTAASARMQRRILVSAGDAGGRIFVCDPSAASGTQMACS